MLHTGGCTNSGQGCSGPSGTEPLQNFLGFVPTVQDPFSCRGRAHEWQAAAALLDRHRGTGAAAGARTKPGALQIFPSKAQRKGIALNYQVSRNILLSFTLQINYFSNKPLTALTTSVTYSPVLRESYYQLENSLRFPVVLHITCTTPRKQEASLTGKRRGKRSELVPHFPRGHATGAPSFIFNTKKIIFLLAKHSLFPWISLAGAGC